jgi:hypothetical protein
LGIAQYVTVPVVSTPLYFPVAVNLLYYKEANVCFCILDAPDVAAVENHHNKAGVKCEWITEVNLARAVPPDKS